MMYSMYIYRNYVRREPPRVEKKLLTLAGPWPFPELRGATTHPPPTTNMKTRRTKTPTTHRADRRSSDDIDERAGSSAVGGEQGRAKRSKKEGMHEHPVEEEAFPRGGGGAYIAPVELKRIREVRVCGGVGGVDESVLAGSPSSSRQPVRLDAIYVSPFTSLFSFTFAPS